MCSDFLLKTKDFLRSKFSLVGRLQDGADAFGGFGGAVIVEPKYVPPKLLGGHDIGATVIY